MPLYKGTDKKTFKKNISAERRAGKPLKQALAIAYSMKRKSKSTERRAGKPLKQALAIAYSMKRKSKSKKKRY